MYILSGVLKPWFHFYKKKKMELLLGVHSYTKLTLQLFESLTKTCLMRHICPMTF